MRYKGDSPEEEFDMQREAVADANPKLFLACLSNMDCSVWLKISTIVHHTVDGSYAVVLILRIPSSELTSWIRLESRLGPRSNRTSTGTPCMMTHNVVHQQLRNGFICLIFCSKSLDRLGQIVHKYNHISIPMLRLRHLCDINTNCLKGAGNWN